jgi:hypothetical protein
MKYRDTLWKEIAIIAIAEIGLLILLACVLKAMSA